MVRGKRFLKFNPNKRSFGHDPGSVEVHSVRDPHDPTGECRWEGAGRPSLLGGWREGSFAGVDSLRNFSLAVLSSHPESGLETVGVVVPQVGLPRAGGAGKDRKSVTARTLVNTRGHFAGSRSRDPPSPRQESRTSVVSPSFSGTLRQSHGGGGRILSLMDRSR